MYMVIKTTAKSPVMCRPSDLLSLQSAQLTSVQTHDGPKVSDEMVLSVNMSQSLSSAQSCLECDSHLHAASGGK